MRLILTRLDQRLAVSLLVLGMAVSAGLPLAASAQTGCPTSGDGVSCFSGKYYCAAAQACRVPVTTCPRAGETPPAGWALQTLSCAACGCTCPGGYSQCYSGASTSGFCVPNRACDPGLTWDVCSDTCVTPYVMRSPSVAQTGNINLIGNVFASKIGLGVTDMTAGGTLGPNAVSALAVPASTETVWGMVTAGTNAPRFALNTNADASWTLYDGFGGSWKMGLTQKNGKFGLGTSNPSTAVMQLNPGTGVEGLRVISSNFTPFVIRNTADTADLFRVDQNGVVTGNFGGTVTGTGTTGYVPKFTSASALGSSNIFDSGWNVGVGTASPTARLHVEQAIASGVVTAMVKNAATNATTNYARLSLAPHSGYNQSAAPYIQAVNEANDAGLSFGTYNSGLSDKMVIKANGNVGISTTNPMAKLEVTGEVVSNVPGAGGGNLRTIGGSYGSFFRNDGGNTYLLLTAAGDQYGSWNSLRPFYVSDSTGDVTFGQNTLFPGSGVWNTAGSVGIGTTTPAVALDVNGVIRGSYGTSYNTPAATYLYLGTLPADGGGNSAKMMVQVTGGSWGSSGIGMTTYYIGNRGGVAINREVHGNVETFVIPIIRMYQQGDGTVKVYLATAGVWQAYRIRSFIDNSEQLVTDAGAGTPGGTNVTPAVTDYIAAVGGNVGIGTTAPGNKLSVVGVSGSGDDTIPALGANGGKFSILNGGGAGVYGLMTGVLGTGNAFMQVQRTDGNTSAYNLLLQPNGGRVGIGTTSPSQKLSIVDASNGGGFNFNAYNQVISTTFGTGGSVQLGVSDAGSGNTSGGGLYLGGSTRGDASKNAVRFMIGTSEAMRVDGDFTGHTVGNVGIGTAAPTNGKLEVQGGVANNVGVYAVGSSDGIYGFGNFHGVNGSSNTYGVYGTSSSTTGGAGVYGVNTSTTGSTYGVVGVANSAGGSGVYATNNNAGGYGVLSGSGKNYFAGNVGIGNASPSIALDVVGAANIWAGARFAVPGGFMASGSLTIGNTNNGFGGGSGWSGNTAGLLMETAYQTEIAVHDAGDRVSSLMYFEGNSINRITIGRDMGWGTIGTVAINGNVGIGTPGPADRLSVAGGGGNINLGGNFPGYNGIWLNNSTVPNDYNLLSSNGDRELYINRPSGRGMHFREGNVEQMFIASGGNVSIGEAYTGFKLYVNGNAYSTGGWSGSDARWKKDVKTITGALGKVEQLRGVTFDWRTKEFPDKGFDDRKHLGFIAQEVEPVVPELVTTDVDGFKSVAYENVTALLVEAVKELDGKTSAAVVIDAAGKATVKDLAVTGDVVAPKNQWGNGSGWIACPTEGECACPNGLYVTKTRSRGAEIYCSGL